MRENLLALSFGPSVDITNAFEMLVESCPGEIDPVLNYWEVTTLEDKDGTAEQLIFFNKLYWAVLTGCHQDMFSVSRFRLRQEN